MHVERLLMTAHVLENYKSTFPDLTFDIGPWYARISECGTAACAVGSVATHPWFNAQGLKLIGGRPRYKNFLDFYAVGKFYELEHDDAAHLFASSRYREPNDKVTPGMVADRIRALVATKLAEQALKEKEKEHKNDRNRIPA